MGYRVLTAPNGEDALRVFQKEGPPIVLTDIKMPGMDGIQLLRRIKHANPDTEVIMITGHGDMDLAIKSLKYRATDFVTKPINDDVLEIALNRALEKIRMRQQLREYTENLEALVEEKSAKLVAAERQVAVGQAVEGFSAALGNIAGDLEGGLTYFNEMPCFVAVHRPDLTIIATNALYKERLGDKVGRNSWEVYANDAQAPAKCPAAQTFESGVGLRTKAVMYTISGNTAPVIVHTAPIRNQSGEMELVLEISADITEVNRLRLELQRTQQRYQQLFDEVPCYISVQDRDFRLTAANRRFKEDFDFEQGAHCYECYKHRKDPCPNCPVAETFADGRPHQAEMVVTAKSGEQYNVLIGTAPLINSTGKITHVMEMSTNITEIRSLQDHLASLGLKISSIAHGIKSLLAGLDGGIYFIETGLAQDNPQRITEGWQDLKTIVDRIRKLILDILFFAKERELQWEQIEVAPFAEDVAATVAPKIEAEGVELVRTIDSVKGRFEIDAGAVRMALINILENALDACMENPVARSHRIEFRAHMTDDQVVFEIADNGAGMDRETRENLFTLFFSSKGTKGTGLGLFIAHKIIDQHNGRIAVDSNPGTGSRFRVFLPRRHTPGRYQSN